MKKMKCPVFARFLLLSLAALAAASRVYAVTIDKADNVLDLNETGSWVGGVLPGTSDIARWNDLVTVAGPFGISSPGVEYGGILIEDPAGPVTLNGAGTLRINSSGIDLSAATQDLAIATGKLQIGMIQTWRMAAGRKIQVTAPIEFPSMVNILGGTTEIGGANHNSGQFTVSGTALNPGLLMLDKPKIGDVNYQAISNMGGTGLTINPFGTARLTGSSFDQIENTTSVNVAGGTFDLNGNNERIWLLQGTAAGVITNSGTTSGILTTVGGTFSGRIEDGPNVVTLDKTGSGTLTLTGASTGTGTVFVSSGTLNVAGSLEGSLVYVQIGARLTGDGPVHSVKTSLLSTISPGGNEIATFEVIEELDLDSATLDLQLNGAVPGSYDRIRAGEVSLHIDTKLNLTLGYTPGPDSFTIIENLSPYPSNIAGRFIVGIRHLNDGDHFLLGGYDAWISYFGGDGNDVVISVVPEPGSAALLLGAGMLGFMRRRRS